MQGNPNHPVTRAVSDQWHKFAALLMWKAGQDHVILTLDDVVAFSRTPGAITIQELDDGIHLRLVDEATAERLAREHGGLPI